MENCNGQMDCTLSNEPMKMDSDNQQEQRALECCPNCGDTKTFGMTGFDMWRERQDAVLVSFICEACGTETWAIYHLDHYTTEAI